MKVSAIKPITFVLVKEIGMTVLLLFGVSIIAFLIILASPGDPFAQLYGGLSGSEAERKALYESLGIPTTWYGQYFSWLGNVLQGDLGNSIRSGRPVLAEVVSAGINTLYLTLGALIVTLAVAAPIAIYTAIRDNTRLTISFNLFAYMISAIPVFWLGYLGIYLSTHLFGFFPLGLGSSDSGNIAKFLLPIFILGMGSGLISEVVRHMREQVSRVMNEEYIRTARAKGAAVWKHAFKEGFLIPVTEIMAIKMPFIIGGAIIIEQVFNWPGMGRMAWQAAQDRDFPVILGITLAAAILVRLSSLLHKIVFVSVNPRASHL
ncbi:MAG: ABC transporter permease [Gammaproteobacteria bacterium]|nr:ABC transporter permease [Gammaproteobacteria bacterium]